MVSIPSPIRSLSLSPSSTITCTVGLASCKIFNVESRSPIHSVPLPPRTYCLTCAFVADGAGIVIGTKEGKVLVVDVASGEVCWVEEGAHEGAVWASAVSPEGDNQSVVTGGADKDVKFWVVEKRGEPTGREGGGRVRVRTTTTTTTIPTRTRTATRRAATSDQIQNQIQNQNPPCRWSTLER